MRSRRVTADTLDVTRRERRSPPLPASRSPSSPSSPHGALWPPTAKLGAGLPGLGMGAGTAIGREASGGRGACGVAAALNEDGPDDASVSDRRAAGPAGARARLRLTMGEGWKRGDAEREPDCRKG